MHAGNVRIPFMLYQHRRTHDPSHTWLPTKSTLGPKS